MAAPSSGIRVIVADDDPTNATTIAEYLMPDGHQIRICPDGESALHLVRSWEPHIVILDVNMPKLSGIDCLKKIRTLKGGEYIGVVLVTSLSTHDDIVLGLDAGADDYVCKPFRMDELRARIRACLRTKSVHDGLRRANKRLEEAARRDELTGLYNMRYALTRLGELIEEASRERTHLSCIMFDMDSFKAVNDQHDHLFGSHVLTEVGQLLTPILRATDLAARYGGDEFFVVLPGRTAKEAFDIAEKVRTTIEGHVFKSGAHSARVTASFGVSAIKDPRNPAGIDTKALIQAADTAMYGAKHGGRNRTET